jgi:hypothetical protein
MSERFPWKAVVASIVMIATRSANAAEPGLTTVDPRNYPVAPAPETTPVAPSAGSTHVFDAFRYHAESAHTYRIASSASSLIIGGVLVGTGIYVEQQRDDGFGTLLTIAGGISLAGGGLMLLFRSEAERMADAHRVDATSNPSPEQEADLERDWEKAALEARGARHIAAAMSLGLAAVAIGGAVYVVAAEPFDEDTQQWVEPTLMVSGAGLAAASLVALMVETPTEAAYGQYKATRGTKPPPSAITNVRVGAAPLPNGGLVSVSTAF